MRRGNGRGRGDRHGGRAAGGVGGVVVVCVHDKLHDRAGASRNGMVAKWKVSGLSKWVVSVDEEFVQKVSRV